VLGDPLSAIDAQIDVVTRARNHYRAYVLLTEQDAVATMGHTELERRSNTRVTDSRALLREFTVTLDELQAERALIIPAL
jgi:hypothetical protein